MSFGENLCKARKLKSMSQEDVAGSLNVSRQSVSFWENNQTVPSLDNLIALCELLEVNSAILLGQEEFPDVKTERERLIKEEERKAQEEALRIERENEHQRQLLRDFNKNSLISLILAVASTLLAFIPLLGVVFPVLALYFVKKARKYKINNINTIIFIFSITYIVASICFFIYLVG